MFERGFLSSPVSVNPVVTITTLGIPFYDHIILCIVFDDVKFGLK